MKKEKYVRICPKCGSVDVKIPPAGLDLKMTKQNYCADCGFIGLFPEIKVSEISNFRKRLK